MVTSFNSNIYAKKEQSSKPNCATNPFVHFFSRRVCNCGLIKFYENTMFNVLYVNLFHLEMSFRLTVHIQIHVKHI